MAKPKLAALHGATLVTMREDVAIKPRKTRDRYCIDNIFFQKSDCAIGAVLENVGQIQRGTLWRVVEVHCYPERYQGRERVVKVDSPIFARDVVVVRNDDTGEVRRLPFTTLAYSAIWRLYASATRTR